MNAEFESHGFQRFPRVDANNSKAKMKLHIGRVQSMLAQPLNYLALFRELFVCFMTAMQAALESTIEEGENEDACHLGLRKIWSIITRGSHHRCVFTVSCCPSQYIVCRPQKQKMGEPWPLASNNKSPGCKTKWHRVPGMYHEVACGRGDETQRHAPFLQVGRQVNAEILLSIRHTHRA